MNIYNYQRPVGKIDDIPGLRDDFIAVYDTKSHQQVVEFCLMLGRHLIEITGFEANKEITAAFEAMQRWLNGEANYHEARNLSFLISQYARDEEDPIKVRFFKTMGQLTAGPHVKYHGLWATDFAVTLVNKMHPSDLDEVKKEREKQLELIKAC